jgi:adenylate kinase
MIVFMGVAGSGKSTQAKLLSEALKCPRLGVGDLLRKSMSGDAAKKMLAGEMIDDTQLLPLLSEEIKKFKNQEFILDGSPRSMGQAKWWVEKVRSEEVKITGVIHLVTAESIAKKRLLARHRPDDYEEAIKERFDEYHHTIEPILSYLRKEGFTVHDINGERDPELVQDEIKKSLGV